MIIKKMQASFGTLDGESLELNSGLNIINNGNEKGKSTWCAFISSMLYGIDGSARAKNGIKPDKEKYIPWNGSPMWGTMEISHKNQDFIIDRRGREGGAFKVLTLTRKESGQEVQTTNEGLGEELLGVSKDVFMRTALISQGQIPINSSPDLEKKIATIAQTGSEEISLSQALDCLKSGKRRRKYNKSGTMPELEKEIEQVYNQLVELKKLEKGEQELVLTKDFAIKKRDELNSEISLMRSNLRKNALSSLKDYSKEKQTQESLFQEKSARLHRAKKDLDATVFGEDTPEEASEKAKMIFKKEKALKNTAEHGLLNPYGTGIILGLILAIASIAGLYFTHKLSFLFGGIALGLSAIIGAIFVISKVSKNKKHRAFLLNEARGLYEKLGLSNAKDLENALHDHRVCYENYEENLAIFEREKEKLSNMENKRQALEEEILVNLDFSISDQKLASMEQDLKSQESLLHRIRDAHAQILGKKSNFPKEEELKTRLEELKAAFEKQSEEFEAFELAISCLEKASSDVQKALSPALCKKALEYFRGFTQNGYEAMEIDEKLGAKVRLDGQNHSHESSYLSAGAKDQLYLSLRLALLDLSLPKDKVCPLILDDALVNFDDARTYEAMKIIYDISKTRQVIMFTCHDREEKILREISSEN